MFVDKTIFLYVHDDPDALVSDVNQRISLLLECCKFNKLSLNPNKSELKVVTHKQIKYFLFFNLGEKPI